MLGPVVYLKDPDLDGAEAATASFSSQYRAYTEVSITKDN